MCSRLLQNMENYQGDLTDILFARSSTASTAPPAEEEDVVSAAGAGAVEWQFSSNNNSDGGFLQMVDHHHPQQQQREQLDEFGDPFSNMRDPLLLNTPNSGFFTASITTASIGSTSTTSPSSDTVMRRQQQQQQQQQPCNNNNNNNSNIFATNMIQISIDNATRRVASPLLVTNDMMSSTNGSPGALNHPKGCSTVENGGVLQQISSPRNTGLKKRKTQAKKVVCIPAPSPANSRPSSGEMVPSDLWAWRKYGQKPIKGSPYPRGYYRCSSSKGCSARKQVERSRADPNMLVITYTSEHNHPWPTQRNALAGSTRNQTATTTKTTGSVSKSSNQSQKSTASVKEEENENVIDQATVSTPNSNKRPMVKEEIEHSPHDSKRVKLDHHHQHDHQEVQFDEGFQQTYRPALPDHQLNHHHAEDFFADLGELEADDPLNLLFTQGYSGDEEPENKSLDPFSFYDWVSNNASVTDTTTITTTTSTITASAEEISKGL